MTKKKNRTISPIWHPMTQHALMPDSILIERAQGAYLYAQNERKILDGISSWWVNTHGHCHPYIVKAVQEQAAKLEQVIFAGFTHKPAEKLAEKLIEITPLNLEHIFFSDSGSTAIEVALKMAIGYWSQTGKPKHKIIALEGGYHGDTFGAMSAGARGPFNALYEPYLFDVAFLPFPKSGAEERTLMAFEEHLKGEDVAALILEPLVQGAAGMRIYSQETLKALHDLCRKYNALLIADEVMTGFGRTGTLFACSNTYAPDLLCLSKGITGGYLPMGATLATKAIYKAFYQKQRSQMFFHSTSFTGNALACAAALANLEIWENEPVMERIQTIAQTHEKAAKTFKKMEKVKDARHKGTIFALDVQDDIQGYLSTLGPYLYDFFLEHDILLRPIGNCIYILPPYCITHEELERIYETIDQSLKNL